MPSVYVTAGFVIIKANETLVALLSRSESPGVNKSQPVSKKCILHYSQETHRANGPRELGKSNKTEVSS